MFSTSRGQKGEAMALIKSIDGTYPSPTSVHAEKQDGDMRKHETLTVRADCTGILLAL